MIAQRSASASQRTQSSPSAGSVRITSKLRRVVLRRLWQAAQAAVLFQAAMDAYEILSDEQQRRSYDLARQRRAAASAGGRGGGRDSSSDDPVGSAMEAAVLRARQAAAQRAAKAARRKAATRRVELEVPLHAMQSGATEMLRIVRRRLDARGLPVAADKAREWV